PSEPIPSRLVTGKDTLVRVQMHIQDAMGNPSQVDHVWLELSGSCASSYTRLGMHHRSVGITDTVWGGQVHRLFAKATRDGEHILFLIPAKAVNTSGSSYGWTVKSYIGTTLVNAQSLVLPGSAPNFRKTKDINLLIT